MDEKDANDMQAAFERESALGPTSRIKHDLDDAAREPLGPAVVGLPTDRDAGQASLVTSETLEGVLDPADDQAGGS